MSKWTIASNAPADGTDVLIFNPNFLPHITIGYFANGFWFHPNGERRSTPSAWQPLPEAYQPPTQPKKGKKK